MVSNFFSENRAVYEIMWKNMAVTDKATDDNVGKYAHALCMLDN
jgi:hypothetical protein